MSRRRLANLVEHFCAVTAKPLAGSDEKAAREMLEACNNNLEMSINTYMERNVTAAGASTGDDNHDSVRAPIPQTTEQMVTETSELVPYTIPVESYTTGFKRKRYKARSVFDGFRDFAAETREQEGRRNTRRVGKARTLEDLFRPPIDITFKGTFTAARDHAVSNNLWLLVNVQDTAEFDCQKLNRDVWSNSAVRSVLKDHFLLFQIYNESEEGRKYMQFYKVDQWPYVAVIDPRTGEMMQVWHQLDALTFCDHATGFLNSHPCLLTNSNARIDDLPPQPELRDSIVDATEEDQISSAITASLTDTNWSCSGAGKKRPNALSDSSLSSDQSDLETFSDSDDPTSLETGRAKKKARICNNLDNQSPSPKVPKSGSPSTTVDECNSDSRSSNGSRTNEGEERGDETTDVAGTSAEHQAACNGIVQDGAVKEGYWKTFVGDETDAKSCLMLRFPDGTREQFSIPCSSTVWAVVHYLTEKGYHDNHYEMVTSFPRRKISRDDLDLTLQAAQLHPQETIFIQAIV